MPSAVPNGRTNRFGTARPSVAIRPRGLRRRSARPAHELAAPPARRAAANTANANDVTAALISAPADVQPAAAAPSARSAVETPSINMMPPHVSWSTLSRGRCARKALSSNADPDFDERVRRSRRHHAEPEARALPNAGRDAQFELVRRGDFPAAPAVRAAVLPAFPAPAAAGARAPKRDVERNGCTPERFLRAQDDLGIQSHDLRFAKER